MKQQMLDHGGYDEWTTDYAGRLICPHSNPIDPDQRPPGDGRCGCVSPLHEMGMI